MTGSDSELSDDLADLAAFVDGEHTEPGVSTYELTFRSSSTGGTELELAANDELGGVWGRVQTESAEELRRALLQWRKLLHNDKFDFPDGRTENTSARELRKMLYLPPVSSGGGAAAKLRRRVGQRARLATLKVAHFRAGVWSKTRFPAVLSIPTVRGTFGLVRRTRTQLLVGPVLLWKERAA